MSMLIGKINRAWQDARETEKAKQISTVRGKDASGCPLRTQEVKLISLTVHFPGSSYHWVQLDTMDIHHCSAPTSPPRPYALISELGYQNYILQSYINLKKIYWGEILIT